MGKGNGIYSILPYAWPASCHPYTGFPSQKRLPNLCFISKNACADEALKYTFRVILLPLHAPSATPSFLYFTKPLGLAVAQFKRHRLRAFIVSRRCAMPDAGRAHSSDLCRVRLRCDFWTRHWFASPVELTVGPKTCPTEGAWFAESLYWDLAVGGAPFAARGTPFLAPLIESLR